MNKTQFLEELRGRLHGLPQTDLEERLTFYGDMIDDRVEEGLTEEEAIDEIGSVDEVVAQILSDTSLSRLIAERIKPGKGMPVWGTVLVILGFPLWLPLLIAGGAVVLSFYVVLWALVVVLWAVDLALAAGAIGGVAAGVFFILRGYVSQGVLLISAGAVLAGLTILMYFVCREATHGVGTLTVRITAGIKSLFLKRGNEQ